MEKAEICRRFGFEIFVEDNKENIIELSKLTKVLCINTRNNKGCKGENIIRVYDFNDIYTEIKRVTDSENSIFRRYSYLSREDKADLSLDELAKYYQGLRECYSHLPFDVRGTKKAKRYFKLFQKILRAFFFHKYKPQVIGEESIPDESGVIFTFNHLCNKDLLLLSSSLIKTTWSLLIKKEILTEKVGPIFRSINAIFVDRKDKNSRGLCIREMAKLLLKGENVLIAPEGTYNKTNNNLLPFSGASAVYLSQALDKYIVPIAITRDYDKGKHPIVRVGAPYKVHLTESLDDANMRLWNLMSDMVEENKKLSMQSELKR